MGNASSNKKERQKKQIQALRSGDISLIESALEDIRATGTPEILPDVFNLMVNEKRSCILLLAKQA